MHRRAASAVLTLAALLLSTAPAAAGRRLTCRDGDPDVLVSPRGTGGPAFCNHDVPGDGACTFAICATCPFDRLCAAPESGVCPEGPLPGNATVVTVPVKHRKSRRVGTTRVVFRCQPPVACNADDRCTPRTIDCQDGVAADPTCDYDGQANGVCTFAFYCLEVCGPTPRETVVVPVGQTRVIDRPDLPRIGFTEFTLRCAASP